MMSRIRIIFIAWLILVSFGISKLYANPTTSVVYNGANGSPITGWERDNDGKIKIKVWLDSLNAEQRRVFKLAMDQWVNWKTADGDLAKSNYDDDAENKDVMSGEPLPSGESGRNLSDTDIQGMKDLYDGTTIEVEYVDNEADSNYKAYLTDETDFGYGIWEDSDGDNDIDKGVVQIVQDLTTDYSWFYVTDSDGDGKITNKDKDASGKSISDYTTPTGNNEYIYNKYDFYSLAKHEIGHTLGFDHSVTVPAPSALLLAYSGSLIFARFRRNKAN